MLSKIAVATLFGVAACAVSAQNIAVVNGKPVPVQRMELLKQQIEERSGRELPAEMEAQLKEEVIARGPRARHADTSRKARHSGPSAFWACCAA